ncbi:NRDE family protein [Alteribacillus sp. HJP-4]|uniref:NRDE family protein n=1 Tax=Alteribacillus sp. HJP-4 TaxID=2775394 RepID=UPI0035CCDC59
MCLIVLGVQAHPSFPIIVVSNRDEFYERPTERLHRWSNSPVMAGRDLKKGGTWMGASIYGDFAAVTNIRNPDEKTALWSRGALVKDFLEDSCKNYFFKEAEADREKYGGFNLIAGEGEKLYYLTNQDNETRKLLGPGVYGLSNARLDTPWPKVKKAKQRFKRVLSGMGADLLIDDLFDVLSDKTEAAEELLPVTGVSLELEKALSPMFINFEGYGTRVQTIYALNKHGEAVLIERSFTVDAVPEGDIQLKWDI